MNESNNIKKIKICWDGANIVVKLDDETTLTISDELKGQIEANDIYNSLRYEYGNRYELLPLDESIDEKSKSFLLPLHNLYSDLCEKINKIKIEDDKTAQITLE